MTPAGNQARTFLVLLDELTPQLRTDRNLPELRVADFGRGVGGGFPNYLSQRDAQREHLTHHVGQVEHDAGGGADMEIG